MTLESFENGCHLLSIGRHFEIITLINICKVYPRVSFMIYSESKAIGIW